MTDDRPWRSLDELEGSAEATFPLLAEAALIDRRMAMRMMAASLALAGASACDRPPSRALRSAPRGIADGRFTDYATTLDQGGLGFGVVVRTLGGRPVKIEGNALHPASLGASNVAAQAALLSLYDPDRSRAPVQRGRVVTMQACRRALRPWLGYFRRRAGEGLHVVLPQTASPTSARLLAQARERLPGARWFAASAAPRATDLHAALESAGCVLSFGADFLGPGPLQVRNARGWIEGRQRRLAAGAALTLIVVESVPTITGARADMRIPRAPSALLALARATVAELDGRASGDAEAVRIAAALSRAGNDALVIAGADQPGEMEAITAALNDRLGRKRVAARPAPAPHEGLAALAAELAADRVADLLILDANPVYDAPVELGMARLIRRAPTSLHLGYHRDETGRACTWHLPARHGLERWGDLDGPGGVAGLVQPVTSPLAPGSTEIELLALLAGERADGRALVRATWADTLRDEEAWLRALEAGVVETAAGASAPVPQPAPTPASVTSEAGLTLLFRPASHIAVGSEANNAWLQELPDPITKLVWGNAATVSPATARRHGLANGDVIAIESLGRSLEAPVWILPGQAADTVALTLGYGRTAAGRIGDGVGIDAHRLRTADAPWAAPCTLRRTGGRARLISTQAHHGTAEAQAIRRVSQGERAAPPSAPPPPTLHGENRPSGDRQWAMTIDLDACIGCAACTIACQAENNIPAVGPDEVAHGREMHWIRVERAFTGSPDAPEIAFQPVPCMHCETAPCEPVCPVEATVHSSEGLNQMVYNRCVGTRSCSNNCPYEVRRFNWFDYQTGPLAAPEPAQNPRVQIRDRGVMEKCTYCVQRIEAFHGDGDSGPLPQTACQQACPTQAIRFGDLAEPDGAVARDRRDPRHYALLDELNTRPRTTYLARIDTRDG